MKFESQFWQRLSPELQGQMLSHLTQSFGTENYRKTFPLVFSKQNFSKFHLLFNQQNQLVAFAATTPFQTRFLNLNEMRLLRGQCIGSVCVPESFRGQGFAKKLLAELIAEIAISTDIACLFATEPALYKHLGFEFCCSEQMVPIDGAVNWARQSKGSSPEIDCLNTEQLLEKDDQKTLKDLWQLLVQQSEHGDAVPSYLEFCDSLDVFNMQVLIARNLKDNKAQGCLYFQKGADFESTWHGLSASNQNAACTLLKQAHKQVPISFFHLAKANRKFFKMNELENAVEKTPSCMSLGVSELGQFAISKGFVPYLPSLLST